MNDGRRVFVRVVIAPEEGDVTIYSGERIVNVDQRADGALRVFIARDGGGTPPRKTSRG